MNNIRLISLGFLPQGDKGVEITIKKMIEQIREGTRDPIIILKAREIVKRAKAKTNYERAKAIFNWVKENIQYVKDPVKLELLRRGNSESAARKILKSGIGDCDEHVVLSASLYRAIGLPVALITISTPQNPSSFSHVYVAVKVGNIWMPSDTVLPNGKFGDEYPYWVRRKFWAIDDIPTELSGWWDTFKKLGKEIIKAGKGILGKAKEEIKKETTEIIETQKQKLAGEVKQMQTENILWWSTVLITILIIAWFLTRR